MLATDISTKSLYVAKKNQKLLIPLKKMLFKKDNLFTTKVKQRFDLIVSNPPYIQSHRLKYLDRDVKNFEPKLALVGGSDRLESYRQIAEKACSILHYNSYLFI